MAELTELFLRWEEYLGGSDIGAPRVHEWLALRESRVRPGVVPEGAHVLGSA